MFHVEEGDVVRMTVTNHSGEVHPMHLHGHHAVVLSRDGVAATGSPWWVDSLNVEDGETYEIAFVADNPGIWMDHCHNLEHARDGLVAHLAYAGVTEPFGSAETRTTNRSSRCTMPKPTDADLERFRALVPDGAGVEVKPMFGHLGAFVNGNMFMGLFGSDVGLKLAETRAGGAAREAGRRALRPGRAPDGRVRDGPGGLDAGRRPAVGRVLPRARRRAAAEEAEGGEEEGALTACRCQARFRPGQARLAAAATAARCRSLSASGRKLARKLFSASRRRCSAVSPSARLTAVTLSCR